MPVKKIGRSALEENNLLAAELKKLSQYRGILATNLMSSPGSGKTALLERTAELMKGTHKIGCLAGDVETDRDAERLRKAGIQAEAITTGGACHLEARMVKEPMLRMADDGLDFIFIENVGNLICPSSYELGESLRVVLLSTPEGHDKPKKYPKAFHKADLVIISKIDLVDILDFDLEAAVAEIKELNPGVLIFKTSAKSGEGLHQWVSYLEEIHREVLAEYYESQMDELA